MPEVIDKGTGEPIPLPLEEIMKQATVHKSTPLILTIGYLTAVIWIWVLIFQLLSDRMGAYYEILFPALVLALVLILLVPVFVAVGWNGKNLIQFAQRKFQSTKKRIDKHVDLYKV